MVDKKPLCGCDANSMVVIYFIKLTERLTLHNNFPSG